MRQENRDAVSAHSVFQQRLIAFVIALMRPLIRILLRYNVSYPEMNQVARWLYVDIAMREREFFIPGRRRQFKARVACLTGLSRKEVLRLVSMPSPDEDHQWHTGNRAARVLNGWLSDPQLRNEHGQPLTLAIKQKAGRETGPGRKPPCFFSMSQSYSGDIPPRAILDELMRAGNVRLLGRNEIEIVNPIYQMTPLTGDSLLAASRALQPSFLAIEHCLQDDVEKAPPRTKQAAPA